MLVCKNCGGNKVEILAWVDANTNEYVSDSGDCDDDSTWCSNCQGHTGLVLESEFNDQQEKEDENDL